MQITSTNRANDRADRGFTLVEILVVIVVLGILAVVVAFSVRGVTDRGETSACGSDATTLTTAADVYMAQQRVDVLPAIGASANRYELFLIDTGLIKQVSTKYDLHEDGTISTTGQPCT
ncbi:MAG TPA: prepilin-type N-terminal cleavage/methylation domain-containing protein [Ilumatobacteraceae bacterium]|nr:prepilin-type N-terminal cleavage/methylation domain-containing protein [Ilumatobacteraceae bacterium]